MPEIQVFFLLTRKRNSRKAVPFGEGIFVYGVKQKLYNVLGVYAYYNIIAVSGSVNKLSEKLPVFLCIFSKPDPAVPSVHL